MFLFVISFILAITGIESTPEDAIYKYFHSDVINQATEIWQSHMVAYENAIALAMKENYGFKGLNVYVKKVRNPTLIATGYYHTDNQVHLVLHDLSLDEFPHLSDPLVRFPLLSNVLRIDAVLSRFNIHANFIQFRNTSNIAYGSLVQDSYKMSPFLFEQVRSFGQLAITVEGCKLSGIGVTSLTGHSINLGNTVLRLTNCHYNFEIFTPGSSVPPVIADYQPNGQGLNVDRLMMKPLVGELQPKLQAMLSSYINTSSVFNTMLQELRQEQAQIFEAVRVYAKNIVKHLNILTITKNTGKIIMDDFSIHWDDSFDDGIVDSILSLRQLVVTGLETIYSSHTGGPIQLTSLKINEELRYATLQVRGSIDMLVGNSTRGMYDFAVEISDVSVDVTLKFESKNKNNEAIPNTSSQTVQVMGWRAAAFSCPGMTYRSGEAFIMGYIQTQLPVYLENHIFKQLSEAITNTDKEYKGIQTLGAPTLTKFEAGPDANVPNQQLNGNPNQEPNGNQDQQPNELPDQQPNEFPDQQQNEFPDQSPDQSQDQALDNDNLEPSIYKDDDVELKEVASEVMPEVPPGEEQVLLSDAPGVQNDNGDTQLPAKVFDDNMFAMAQNNNENVDADVNK